MNTLERTDKERDEEQESRAVVILESPDQINTKDDDAIIAMLTGQAMEEYVYTFRQGGKVVEGLTLAGINEVANRRGGIMVEEVRFEERENSWLVIVKATDTLTGSSRYGAYEQPKKVNGREDPFAFTKAVHKAQRNAIKQLLPTPVIREVINFYLRGQRPPAALIAAKAEEAFEEKAEGERRKAEKPDQITVQQKAAFSLAQQLRDSLDRRGISQQDFWNYVRRRFNVQSRNDMREEQWAQLAAELRAALDSEEVFRDFVARIERVSHAERTTGAPLANLDETETPEAEGSRQKAEGSEGRMGDVETELLPLPETEPVRPKPSRVAPSRPKTTASRTARSAGSAKQASSRQEKRDLLF